MHWFWMAVLSSIVFGFAGFFMKVSQMKNGSLAYLLFGLYGTGTLGFLIHSLWEGSFLLTDWRVWVSGLIVGMGSAWGNVLFMKALEVGPASLTSPFTNMNIVLVIVMSIFLMGERIGGFQVVGIILLITAVTLISVRKEPLTITEKKWFLLVSLAMVLFAFRNGGLKVTAFLGLPNTPILFISYIASLLWFGVTLFSQSNKLIQPSAKRTGLFWGLIAGIFSYGGLQLYSLALQSGVASIVAPIFATNSLVIALGSILIYREKLTLKQTLALTLLLIGLVFVRI